jgi:hypothetical protein
MPTVAQGALDRPAVEAMAVPLPLAQVDVHIVILKSLLQPAPEVVHKARPFVHEFAVPEVLLQPVPEFGEPGKVQAPADHEDQRDRVRLALREDLQQLPARLDPVRWPRPSGDRQVGGRGEQGCSTRLHSLGCGSRARILSPRANA